MNFRCGFLAHQRKTDPFDQYTICQCHQPPMNPFWLGLAWLEFKMIRIFGLLFVFLLHVQQSFKSNFYKVWSTFVFVCQMLSTKKMLSTAFRGWQISILISFKKVFRTFSKCLIMIIITSRDAQCSLVFTVHCSMPFQT